MEKAEMWKENTSLFHLQRSTFMKLGRYVNVFYRDDNLVGLKNLTLNAVTTFFFFALLSR